MKKRQHLKQPPKCLLLFLKRFEQKGQSVIKLDEQVRVDEFLELKSTINQNASIKFKSVSLVEHIGSLSNGHYTCKSLMPNGSWVAFSDDRTVQASVDYLRKPGSSSNYLCALEAV